MVILIFESVDEVSHMVEKAMLYQKVGSGYRVLYQKCTRV